MKKILLAFLVFFTCSWSTEAQTLVQFNIHHKLGDQDFAFNTAAKNNIDHDFNYSRLQYYISEISVIHDGGTVTAMEDLFVLVDAAEPTEVDLGSHDITHVESIRFHIGVDPDFNHLDPASYPSGHPLAPVFPSMHWGWSAGYRFVAIEGMGGSSFNQLFQIHGLGDNNYFETEVLLDLTAENGTVTIDIDGDYTRALEDIQVKSGLISHGDLGAAGKALENFRDYVFSPSEVTSATVDFSEVGDFSVFPNPATSGTATVAVSASGNFTYEIAMTDILGRQVQPVRTITGTGQVTLNAVKEGIYFVHLIKEGEAVLVKKLIVQ